MRQLAMRYDAGEELSSITNDLAVPSESAAQVHQHSMHRNRGGGAGGREGAGPTECTHSALWMSRAAGQTG